MIIIIIKMSTMTDLCDWSDEYFLMNDMSTLQLIPSKQKTIWQ